MGFFLGCLKVSTAPNLKKLSSSLEAGTATLDGITTAKRLMWAQSFPGHKTEAIFVSFSILLLEGLQIGWSSLSVPHSFPIA